jgi:hypothetical protein
MPPVSILQLAVSDLEEGDRQREAADPQFFVHKPLKLLQRFIRNTFRTPLAIKEPRSAIHDQSTNLAAFYHAIQVSSPVLKKCDFLRQRGHNKVKDATT